MTVSTPLTPQQLADLEVARSLAAAGVPIFLALPDQDSKAGFSLPRGWEQTTPDPSVVDRWRPGMALCAVMGCGLDLLDVDPRNGGGLAAIDVPVPNSYGVALTPSGGVHSFVASMGVGSRDAVFDGVDVKGGMPDGSSRGFAFLAPTVRPSKVTGEPAAYRWAQTPELERLAAEGPGDTSGAGLAERVRALKADSGVSKVGGPDFYREFLLSREPQAAAAADKAIEEKLREVAEWQPGTGVGFRQVLLRAALTLGGYVGGSYLDEDDARERLEAAVGEVWTTADEDDLLWIAQGLSDGQAQPFYVYTAADALAYGVEGGGPVPAPGGDAAPPWTVYSAIGLEPFDPTGDGTDQGLAEAVAARMYPALRFGVDSGTWLVRGREVWREREDMTAWAVATVARLMPLGDPQVPKDVALRTPAHWQAVRRQRFMDSGGSGKVERKLKAIVRNSDHPAGTEITKLDADPEILWAGGTPYNLRESLEAPVVADIDPATPHLHTAAVAPQRVPTPAWDRFVATVFPDPELRAWALRVLSVALAGYPDAVLPVLYGPERTGKTSLVQLIIDVLGTYAHAADPRLLGGADNVHASVVYALKGRRLSFIDEGPRRGHLAAERLKQLTGGGALTGNAMRSNPVTFAPTHTLVMTTNEEPPVTDPALRARMRIIPAEADKAAVRAARKAITPAVWAAESPGVLAQLMAECSAWLLDPDTAGSDRAPGAVRSAVAEMAAGQSPVLEWVEMCTLPADPGTQARALYRSFCAWFEGQPIYRRAPLPSETAWGRALTEAGYPKIPGQGPKRNQNYRPLSVLNGGGWPLGPMPGTAPAAPVSPEGSPRVPEGPAGQPSDSDPRSSDPVSSSSSDSSDSTSRTTTLSITTHTPNGVAVNKYRGNRDETLGPRTDPSETSADQHQGVSPEGLPDTRVGGQEDNGTVTERSDQQERENRTTETGSDLRKQPAQGGQLALEVPSAPEIGLDTPDPSRPVTAAQVARRADALGISKPEARAQLKAEQRAAAIRLASGETLPLPAAVDRAGNALSLTLEQAAATVRHALARSGVLTVDVEHTGYPIGHPLYALRSVQLGDDAAAVVFDPTQHAELIRTLLAEAKALGAFSATADLVPIAYEGLGDPDDLWERMHDVVIPAKLADPTSTGAGVDGLKKLSPALLGPAAVVPAADEARKAVFKAGRWLEQTKVDTPFEKSGWAQIETASTAMVRYAASDVLDTAALAKVLPTIPAEVYERERLAQRMTARITHRGLRIDATKVAELTGPALEGRAAAGARIMAFGAQYGMDNPGSDQQIGKVALALGATLPTTDKGNVSVAAGVLEPLRSAEGAVGEFVRAVLDYRHHDTQLGTFLEPYRLLCEQGDGRARPTVYTLGTDTGRMSCVRPNLQQLPREGGVRACIAADPGQLMIGADFSGVEIRVAAALSQDQTLLQLIAAEDDFNDAIAARAAADGTSTKVARAAILAERGQPHGGNGDGLHWVIARQVWGEDAGKADRYAAKRIVFGRLYGGGIPTLAKQAGVSESIASSAVDVLDALTPQLAEWSQAIRDAVRRGHTQFPSYSGRIIHLPREFPHKGPNYCIQGTARELLIDALVRWSQTRWADCTLLPVHDELDVFVPAEDAEEATRELVRCMETTLHGVKIIADPSDPSPFWPDSV